MVATVAAMAAASAAATTKALAPLAPTGGEATKAPSGSRAAPGEAEEPSVLPRDSCAPPALHSAAEGCSTHTYGVGWSLYLDLAPSEGRSPRG